MNRYKSLAGIFSLIFVISIVACNKGDDTKLSMEGSVDFECPEYAYIGESFDLHVEGVEEPEDVTYKWVFSWNDTDTLSGQDVTMIVPAEAGKYTAKSWASKDGYYDYPYPAVTNTITVVDPEFNKTIRGLTPGEAIYTDIRDGNEYNYRKIGNLYWFVENLRWAGAGIGMYRSDIFASATGRFYSWSEVTGGVSYSGLGGGPQSVCPEGWSVPTNEDWMDMANTISADTFTEFEDNWSGIGEKLAVNAIYNDDKIWEYSPDNALDNDSGFNAIPVGNVTINNYIFKGLNRYAFFWSSTEYDTDQAYYRYIYYNRADFPYSYIEKNDFGASVRCVKPAN